jgi:hypothetical protein
MGAPRATDRPSFPRPRTKPLQARGSFGDNPSSMSAALAAVLLLQVQVRDESKDWRLLRTDHFDLYYPSEALLPRAREFAGWFERAREELKESTGVEPRRISVFLYRSFLDLRQSNFLASVRPGFARLRDPRGPAAEPPNRELRECRPHGRGRALALAEPLRDRIFIHCQASDRWNYWFIKHELAHHCQFELLFPWRLPSWLIALRNPLIPAWWWEGGADYWAGIFDPMKDQFVRDLGEEGFYELADLFEPDVLNPYDYLAIYYQGSYFWRFLEESYGPGTARLLFERTGRGLPLVPARPLQAVVGKKRAEIEREFHHHERTRWAGMLQGRGVPTDRLTDTRSYYRRRAWGGRWSPDGTRLAWIGDSDVVPELYVDGRGLLGRARSLDGSRLVSPPSWSPDGRRLAVILWRTNRDLILLVNENGGSETIALDFDEVYDPAWSPDGSRLAFTALKDGTSDLYTVDLATQAVERLTNDPEGDFQPAWSPSGDLAWIKETEGRTVLHVLSRGAVTRSWALMEYPQWSPDGGSIVVSAAVEGIYDAFEVDPGSGRARRLTRFRGGVAYPQWHPRDGTLLFTYYAGRGQDLYRVVPEPQDEPGFDEEHRKDWYAPFRKTPVEGTPAEKSRRFGMDWLMFPTLGGSLLTPGVEMLAGDLDAENRLGAFGYYAGREFWNVSAVVTNTRWRPTLGVLGSAGRRGDLVELQATPFIDVPILNTLVAGVGWTLREREQRFDGGPLDEVDVRDAGPLLAVLYANQRSYQYWDPAWGFSAGVTASFFRKGFGGERNLNEYRAFLEASTDIVQDWILWLRADWERLDTDDGLLEAELLDVDRVVRGAKSLEGTQRGVLSVELRFPIWRDLLFKPLGWIGIPEWFVLKDIRGFAFAQAGYAGTELEQMRDDDFGAASAGAGLRFDFSVMVWPIVNGRVPLRLELWGAVVGRDEKDPRAEWGGLISFSF